jgi:hypothetical protein
VIRIPPHFFNTTTEFELVFELLHKRDRYGA